MNPVHASDFHSARTAALGGAGHAGPFINDALYLNPSFISYLTARSVSVSFQKFGPDSDSSNSPDGRLYNVSIQDGTAPIFQAGVGFTQRDEGPLLTVGASKTILATLGVGLAYKLWISEREEVHPQGSDATIATTWIAEPWLQMSLTWDNIFQSRAAVHRNAPRELVLGSKSNIMEIFQIYVDPHWTFDVPDNELFGLELGAEFTIMKDLFFRLGYARNAYQPFFYGHGDAFGVGVGWVAPKLSIEYGLSRVVRTTAGITSGIAHTFGATIFF